jgi:hypothetical protein
VSLYKHFDRGKDAGQATKEFMSTLHELHADEKAGSSAARAALIARDDAAASIKVDTVPHMISTKDKNGDIRADAAGAAQHAEQRLCSLQDQLQLAQYHLPSTTNGPWALAATTSL